MCAKRMLSPYYYGEPLAGLDHLVGSDWARNQVDLPPTLAEPTPQQMMTRMITIYRPLAAWVAETVRAGDRPITLSGDCSSAMAVLTGVQSAGLSPTFIWFDAHGDFNTWATTPSGYLGGMPLAIISGRGEQMVPQGLGMQSSPDEQIILTDARELDPGEVSNLQASAVTHLTDVAMLLDYNLPDRPIALHFDVDVLNHADAPAMEFPAVGGPSAATLAAVFRHIVATGRLVSVSVSSWVPSLDKDGQTASTVMELLKILAN